MNNNLEPLVRVFRSAQAVAATQKTSDYEKQKVALNELAVEVDAAISWLTDLAVSEYLRSVGANQIPQPADAADDAEPGGTEKG